MMRYFPRIPRSRWTKSAAAKELTMKEVQSLLSQKGASDLVVDLIKRKSSHSIFKASVNLAIALLDGGNDYIQVGVDFYSCTGVTSCCVYCRKNCMDS